MNTNTRIGRLAAVTSISLALLGCISIPDINSRYHRIGMAWQLDNQRIEEEYRFRVIDSDYLTVFNATRRTFLALGMPVQSRDLKTGVLYAENIAPSPLSQEEWMEIKRIETPRLKEIGGSLFSFPDNPKNFIITVRAEIKPLKSGETLVMVDHLMSSPEYKKMGILVTSHAPPTAVKLGSAKFWTQLSKEVSSLGIPAPRKRRWNEES